MSAVSEGASYHEAAARFGGSVSSASRWSERFRHEGQLAPKPSGGDHASHRIEAQAELILTTYEARSAIFLHELRDALASRGVQTRTSSLSRLAVPHGHYKTTTVTAALRSDGLCATALFDGATNGVRFWACVTDTLVPVLRPGDTVSSTTCKPTKWRVYARPQEAGGRILYLPPYSPDFNPIEQIFAKLKGPLRTAAARTVPDLWNTIRLALARFTADECRNCLAAAGYGTDLAIAK